MANTLKEKLDAIQQGVPFRLVPALVTVVFLVVMLLLPVPDGLTGKAWALVAIFLSTILAIILKVMPIGAMAMIAIMAVAVSEVTAQNAKGAIADALSSFSNSLIWLIVIAIFVSRGLKKTGLGNRAGLLFISRLGRRTIGIGYGLAVCELVLALFMPSNTARGGGILHPIMRSIAGAFGSDPAQHTESKIGSYLALVNMHSNTITSGMFVTATAPNPLVVNYIARVTNQEFYLSWTTWFTCMVVPGLACLLLMPLLLFLVSPPEIRKTPHAVQFAREELDKMGPLTHAEKVMMGTFALLLLLWANVPAMILGPAWVLDSTTVAFVGLVILLLTGTINWNDMLTEKSAWDTLVWFGALVMMAEQLNKTGVVDWFSALLKGWIVSAGLGWQWAAVLLILLFVLSHYFFASTTAHISAMMLAFLTVGASLIPAEYLVPFLLMMAAGSTIMMKLTHYATGTSPIIFNSGYVTLGKWWMAGLLLAVVELAVYATLGVGWWKVLGLW